MRGLPATRMRFAADLWCAIVFVVAGCAGDAAGPGWSLSPGGQAVAQPAPVPYDSAPPWDEGAHCAGGLTPGGVALGDALQARFPQIARVYGYACRQNTAVPAEQSQHGTGRAVDLAVPTVDGEADNARGDPIAQWLVEHAVEIGIQLIIWDRGVWYGPEPAAVKPYAGPDPHIDHLHVELTEAGARQATPFFASPAPG